MMARQYRTCPPHDVKDDPLAAPMVRRHVARCSSCAMETREADAPWRALAREIEKAFPGGSKTSEPPDPRREFRKLERDVAGVFAGLQPVYGSARETEKAVKTAAPGVTWKQWPQGVDEVLALARFPEHQLPLAAAEVHGDAISANLAMLRDGEVQTFVPVPLTIFGKTGNLMIAGRITGLPAGGDHSRLICRLEVPDGASLSPDQCRWNPKDGNFVASFEGVEGIEGTLRAAVVVSSEE